MTQGTPEWHARRAGKVTASRFADVLSTVKVGEAAGRIKYRWELVAERLTGEPVPQYTNKAMERGTALEPEARMAYEAQTGNVVTEVEFIDHPDVPLVGCSPDGLIDADGGLEIKCPENPVIHVQTIHGGMPTEHRAQVQGAMWVTGRAWWDFVSYDPRMPGKLQLYVERIKRDEAYIERLAAEVKRFNAEVAHQHQSLLVMAA
jgi:putative phage-type endonuclease